MGWLGIRFEQLTCSGARTVSVKSKLLGLCACIGFPALLIVAPSFSYASTVKDRCRARSRERIMGRVYRCDPGIEGAASRRVETWLD